MAPVKSTGCRVGGTKVDPHILEVANVYNSIEAILDMECFSTNVSACSCESTLKEISFCHIFKVAPGSCGSALSIWGVNDAACLFYSSSLCNTAHLE